MTKGKKATSKKTSCTKKKFSFSSLKKLACDRKGCNKMLTTLLFLALGVSLAMNLNAMGNVKVLETLQESLTQAQSELQQARDAAEQVENAEISAMADEDFAALNQQLVAANGDRVEVAGNLWIRQPVGQGQLTIQVGNDFWSKVQGPVVKMQLAIDSSCTVCKDISKNREQIQEAFPFAEIAVVDIAKQGRLAGLSAVPMIVFDKIIQGKVEFENLKSYVREIDSGFEFDPSFLRLSSSKRFLDSSRLPKLNKKKSQVAIVEFSEFLCPFCKRFDEETLPKIREKYGDKVKIDFRHLIVHGESAKNAAQANECAGELGGEEEFWKMHDLLFANQSSLGRDKFVQLAEQIGLSKEKFEKCLNDPSVTKLVEADSAEGKGLGVNGTPGIFVDDIFIGGALPFETFDEIIQAKLDEK